MFKANAPSQYVPSKSIAIKPDVVSDVLENDQIRINIPSYVNFVDPNQTYLKFDLKLNNVRGQLVPDKHAGGHALIRNIYYRDGNNSAMLEANEDYNANYAMMSNYTAQDSINHKRELFEGKVSHIGDQLQDKTLFYKQATLDGGATATVPDANVRGTNTPTLQFQLNSGIFKQGKILPVSAMNGMKIQIDTEDIGRAFQYLDTFGEYKVQDLAGRFIKPTKTYNQGDDKRTATVGFFNVETDCPIVNNPFVVGDQLYLSASSIHNTLTDSLGFINGFFPSTADASKLGIQYTPNRVLNQGITPGQLTAANCQLCYKATDRMLKHTVFSPNDTTDVRTRIIEKPSYAMSDIELITQTVSPPEAYSNGILKAAQSAGGINFDIMSYELYRHNQSNVSGLLQAQIPTQAKRAMALFVQPLVANQNRDVEVSSLVGVPDNARSYEFVHGSKHMPSRLVPLGRYSSAVGTTDQKRNEALHTSELHKAILNAGEKVYSLQKIANNFVIGRSLSKYGGTTDLSGDSLSVRVDYNTGANVKLFNNYVYCLRRIMIKDGVVQSSNQVPSS